MPSRRHLLTGSAATVFCAALGVAHRAWAQSVSKPCRIVVGFPPGSAPDVVARLMADGLRGTYAHAVIVENKAGAGGRIAAEAVKTGDPDGSTMLVTPNPIVTIYPHVYRKLPYDPLHDLTPVTSLCSYPLVLSAGPALPLDVKTLAGLVGISRDITAIDLRLCPGRVGLLVQIRAHLARETGDGTETEDDGRVPLVGPLCALAVAAHERVLRLRAGSVGPALRVTAETRERVGAACFPAMDVP